MKIRLLWSAKTWCKASRPDMLRGVRRVKSDGAGSLERRGRLRDGGVILQAAQRLDSQTSEEQSLQAPSAIVLTWRLTLNNPAS